MKMRRVVALVAAGSLVAACSSGSAPSASAGGDQTVTATLKEWQISLSSANLKAGKVTFHIINNGDKEHEFVVRKTALKPDALPVNAAGEIKEDAPELAPAGEPSEVANIASGSSDKTLTLTLQPGHYVIFCNLNVTELLHYQKGMRTEFTVT